MAVVVVTITTTATQKKVEMDISHLQSETKAHSYTVLEANV